MVSDESRVPAGLYIHIPFCRVKCRYCAFAVFPGLRGQTDRYLQALVLEMELHRGRAIDTIYFGGGTPSLLPVERWHDLMRDIRSRFRLAPQPEITVECNPEDVTPELVRALREEGINRLSLGLQTIDDAVLKKIGRTHTWEDCLTAFSLCRGGGMRNLSIDLIFGLPGQSLGDWRRTLERVLPLRPEHLSTYALDLEKRSAFYFDGVRPDADLAAEMAEWGAERIEQEGYERYEISSYALAGCRCRHNLKYWRNLPTLGVGLAAAGYDGAERRQNTEKFGDYVESMEAGRSPVRESERLSGNDRLREEIMLGLRLKEGMILTPEIRASFGEVLERLAREDYLRLSPDGARIFSTARGWLLASHVCRELLG